MSRQSLSLIDDAPRVPLYQGNLEEDLKLVSHNRLAEKITGGLSHTSKLPCPSWGIPATRCKMGSVLALQRGSTCHRCYAMKGHYRYPKVRNKLQHRFKGLFHDKWTPAMIQQIRWECDDLFRWFDSGDVRDQCHLQNIITICEQTRDITHWLPTQEHDLIRSWKGTIPNNLIIRLSTRRIDGPPPTRWQTTSTVTASKPRKGSYECPASDQGNSCDGPDEQQCRACWDPTVRNVSYWVH